ncbi:TIGR02677 family protein [Enterococcus camelliae]|uniref:TIGR02677 family protein n=1 Tax=Enterococcus camelliae TaxID=453959 RepID=A0ABW5THC3_9ENTE
MERIFVTNYLNVENVGRYRLLMRFLYKRHRQMQGTIYRPELLKMMQREYPGTYSELDLDNDLENLVAWGNLLKQQEMIRPKSIEEYRNKNFRYQISEDGVLVEEMVYQMTHREHSVRGALNEQSFRRLLDLLEEFVDKEYSLIETWTFIREEFKKIGEDTSNYIGYITSPEVDSRMKTEEFLIYKDKFVNYLREFISSVQSLYFSFVRVIKKLDQINQEQLIEEAYQKEQEIPAMHGMSREEVAEQIQGELAALGHWFIDSSDRPSEYDNLLKQTDQMISKITGLIYYFSQEIHQYQSRKKDYRHLATWFAKADNLDQAKEMYAAIFGIDHTRHYFVTETSEASSKRENSWELAPAIISLNNRGKGSRNDRKVSSVRLDRTVQIEQMQQYQREVLQRQQKIKNYFHENVLDFHEVVELDATSRKVFLKWISQAIATKQTVGQSGKTHYQQVITTEFDFTVVVSVSQVERITVPCEDGVLEMPAVRMVIN